MTNSYEALQEIRGIVGLTDTQADNVESILEELENIGYENGESDGRDTGFDEGYDTGYQEGHESGYDDGVTDTETKKG